MTRHTDPQRDTRLHDLARKLLFEVEQHGDRFTLQRTTDVEGLVRHEDLTNAQAEELLNTWKLRGPHGG